MDNLEFPDVLVEVDLLSTDLSEIEMQEIYMFTNLFCLSSEN